MLASFRTPAALSAQLDGNLRLLRREHVDVLQVHEADWRAWWSDETPHTGYLRPDREYDFANAPVMQYLREAQEQGRCRFVGITGNIADDVARVLRDVDVDAVLVAFNYDLIWRRTRTHALPLARERGAALLPAAVFQNVRLAEVHPKWLESPPNWMNAEVQARFARLYELQREYGLALVELTIRFLLAEQAMSTILVGAARPSEIEISVAAAQAGALPADLHQAVEELGLEEPQPFI